MQSIVGNLTVSLCETHPVVLLSPEARGRFEPELCPHFFSGRADADAFVVVVERLLNHWGVSVRSSLCLAGQATMDPAVIAVISNTLIMAIKTRGSFSWSSSFTSSRSLLRNISASLIATIMPE